MNTFFLIYILGIIIIPIVFLILNQNYKWMTKKSHEFDNADASFVDFFIELFLAALMWPLILLLGLIFGTLYLIYKLCIPKGK